LEALAGDLIELQQQWSVNLRNGVDAARGTVTTNLIAHINRLKPPKRGPKSGLTLDAHVKRYKWCIAACFNILDTPELRATTEIGQRRDWLDDEARGKGRLSVSTSQRYLNDAVSQIEQQIRASRYAPVSIDDVTIERPAQEAVTDLENGQLPQELFKSSDLRRLITPGVALLAAASISAGLAAGGVMYFKQDSHTQTNASSGQTPTSTTPSARSIPDLTPRPASASDPPVLVEGVTPLGATDDASLIYVVPEKIDMSPTDLAAFDRDMSDTDNLKAWMKDHKAIRLGNLTTKVTLAGNIKGATATITDIEVINKQCHTPNEATIFALLGGGDTPNTPLSFDLTQQDPHAKDKSGENFFMTLSTSLAYGEVENFSVKIKTQAECTFKLQLDVATSSGTLTQIIDDHGQPFLVTSYPASDKPYSMYQEVYMKEVGANDPWTKKDPKLLP